MPYFLQPAVPPKSGVIGQVAAKFGQRTGESDEQDANDKASLLLGQG
jgi:hypothetical protein